MSVPNVERFLFQHVLAYSELTVVMGSKRLSTELPANAPLPRIRVSLIGGTVLVRSWLYNVRVGLEAWGDTKDEAWDAMAAALASVEDGLEGALVEDGVVTATDQDTGIIWSPDPETATARYLTTVSLTVHPNTGDNNGS
jgi:hypothetical protein